ncbi:MAG: gliding motility-associated C-terminal domain-containing protein [Bacteroidota bacterium]
MIKNWIVLCGLLYLAIPKLCAQSLTLSLPDTSIQEDETVLLRMQARDFEQITSIQFSLVWDVSVIEFMMEEQLDLGNIAVGATQASEGILRLSWFPPTGQPESLPDGADFIGLQFRAVGAVGDTTTVEIVDAPLMIQVTQATDIPNEFVEIDLVQDTGVVRIGTPLGLNVEVDNISCFGLTDGVISLSFANFPEGGRVEWSGPNDFTASANMLEGLEPGNYQLTVFDAQDAIVLTTVIPIEAPEAALMVDSIGVSPTACGADTGTATILASGGSSPFSYELAGGATNQTGLFESLAAGAYTVSIIDANGCTIDTTFAINEPILPTIDLGGNQQICAGETLVLDAGEGFEQYQWSTGAATTTIEVGTIGTYSVTVTDASNCLATATVEITQGEDLELVIENDLLEVCPGDSIELVVSGATFYEWIDTSQTLNALDTPSVLARPISNTSYTVIGSNACKQDTALLEVTALQTTATAGPDTCIIIGEELELDASGGLVYIWEPNFDFPLSDPTIPNPIISPEDSTNYVVTIVDSTSCIIIDSVLVEVIRDIQDLRAINLITPNDDGKNDVLEFRDLGKFRTNTLKVFNRWGDQVYNKVNYQSDDERFDGTFNGQDLPAGTYFYVLSLRAGEIKQALTIVRD